MNTPVDAAARLVAQTKEEYDKATTEEERERRGKQYNDAVLIAAFLLRLHEVIKDYD